MISWFVIIPHKYIIDFPIMFTIKTNQTYFSYHLLPNRPILTGFFILLYLTEPAPSSLDLVPEPVRH